MRTFNDIFNSSRFNSKAISSGEINYDYRDLNFLISKYSSFLQTRGIKQQDLIPIVSRNSWQFVVSLFALWNIGAVPVPLNCRQKASELLKLFKLLKSETVLAEKEFIHSETNLDFIDIDQLPIVSGSASPAFYNKLSDTALLLFTSGTTGTPKGVEISFSNILHNWKIISEKDSYSSNDIFLASLPFYHIGGFSIIIRALLSSAQLVIRNDLKGESLIDSLFAQKITRVSLVPAQLQLFVESGKSPPDSLKTVYIGGGPSHKSLIEKAITLGWPLVKVYGSTETTAMVTHASTEELSHHPDSSGKPLGNQILITDENLDPIHGKVIGNIVVSGKSVAKGYLFTSSENQPLGGNKFLTSDRGFFDKSGNLLVVSRSDRIIISGGENIDPTEVEKCISEIDCVKECFVFGLPDEKWGEEVCAVFTSEEPIEKEAIIANLRDRIAGYKIPRQYLRVKEFPINELGKVEIEELRKLF